MAGKCRLPCPEHRMGEAGDPQERVRTCLRCLPLEGGIGVWRENRNIALNIIFRGALYTGISQVEHALWHRPTALPEQRDDMATVNFA